MKRRKARECALQALFRAEFTKDKPDRDALKSLCDDTDDEVYWFFVELVEGTLEHLAEIDAAIKEAAEHWAIDRMAAVDRNILRAATYEILYRMDIPPAVSINEAIEIAKKYSAVESASFINGILDNISKRAKRAATTGG